MSPVSSAFEVPPGWTRGELLDTERSQGYHFRPLYCTDPLMPALHFTNAEEAQNFLGWWYYRGPSQ